LATRQTGHIGATLYVDVQNLGLDDMAATNVVSYILGNWPNSYPRITAISLYTNPGDNERWKAILSDSVSKQLRKDRRWPFAGVNPRENVPAMQHYSRSRSKNTADIALCLDACKDFLQEKTEFVSVVSNDSDFFVLFSKCQEWQEDMTGGRGSNDDAPFLLITHKGQPGGGLLSPNMAAIPPKFRWELPEEARESPATRITPEEIARSLTLGAEVGVGLPLDHFQGQMKEDHVLNEHPAATLEPEEFESFFRETIWPLWQEWGISRGSARIAGDTLTLYTVSDSSRNNAANTRNGQRAEPVSLSSEGSPDARVSVSTPVEELVGPQGWDDIGTRTALVALVGECYSKQEYTGREGREQAFEYFKSNFGNHQLSAVNSPENWDRFWTDEVTPVFRIVKDVIAFCHGKDTFTATDVRQRVKEEFETHWLGQVEQGLWNSPVWSQMLLPILQREGTVREISSGGPGTRYTIPLPAVNAGEIEIIFQGLADKFRGRSWQSAFPVHRSLIASDQSYQELSVMEWVGDDNSRFGRWWGTFLLPKLNSDFGLQRAPGGTDYRIWPDSDDDAAREFVRLMLVDETFEAQAIFSKFKRYSYPQASGSLDDFQELLEETLLPLLQNHGVETERGGLLGRGERTFTVPARAREQVNRKA
jgi:hypothetical protein